MMEKKLTIALAGNANVGKSLSGEEYIFVNNDKQWKTIRIKDLANHVFKSSPTKEVSEGNVATPQNLFVISLNLKTLKVEKKKVTRVLRHREKRKHLCLKTSSGRTLQATKDHNFIVLRNGKPRVVNGEGLSLEDQLPVIEKLYIEQSKPILDLGDYISRKINANNKQYQVLDDHVIVHGNKIPRVVRIDKNWARFFGLYLAEGSMAQLGQIPRIATAEENIKNFIKNHLKCHDIPCHSIKNIDKNAYDVGVSKVLKPILQEFGSNSDEKKIPSFVYEWDDESIRSLLRGYFDGDGWEQATAIHANTKSIKLQLGLIILLALTNKHTRLNVKQIDGTPYYEVRYVPKPCKKRSQWLERIRGIGDILRQARKATGLTQLGVVRKLGWKAVKGTYISALENERRSVTKKFLQKLVNLYRKYATRGSPALNLLERLAFSDVVWDKITEIGEADNDDGYVYDLVVQGNENFMLANGLFVHNSVIFNHLTGLHQHIGNWPGKTVEKAEGTLHFKGYTIDIIDLPGIYSLSTFSIEELISREYIAVERPDLVINVVDASVLERNLFFTLQLMELETPMIMALNQVDMAKSKGIEINIEKLEHILRIPVIPTVAIKGVGVYDLLKKAVEMAETAASAKSSGVNYGDEIERRIGIISNMVSKVSFKYPPRYTAIQLLQGDEEIVREARKIDPEIVSAAEKLAKEIEEIHIHSCSTVITSERYEIAGRIAREVQSITTPVKPTSREALHNITTHRILGYPIMLVVVLSMFFAVFTFGNRLSELLGEFFMGWQPIFENIFGAGIIGELIWGGVMEGIIAGITIALPYIAPFYLMLYFLEDSGYLSRVAFLMDNLMHKIGLHGKAFIPAMLGYGCNVPACLGCRIMETERERLLAGFVTTLVPCAARTVIILGLVGAFIGIQWALALYVFDLLVIFALGRIAFKVLPGEPTALIMEMSDYRIPHLSTVAKQTWFRLEEFIKIAFPLIVVGSVAVKLIEILGLLEPIGKILSPITVTWLGLPAITGIALIFGVLRKELTLIMLATLLGTTNFAQVLTPVQMVVFTLVTMFYIPCVATIAALVKEFGWKKALLITAFEIIFAISLGGVALRILTLTT